MARNDYTTCEGCGRECRRRLCAKCSNYILWSEESQGRKGGSLGRFAHTPIRYDSDEHLPRSDQDYHGDSFRDDI